MNTFHKVLIVALFSVYCLFGTYSVQAATTPSLGEAASFGVLTETFTNTIAGTTINGDLGYITAPAMAPTVNGTTYIGAPDPKIISGTADQGVALANLNSQTPCQDIGGALLNVYSTGGNPPGTFSPGCYSDAGAMTTAVGPVTITLSGAGTYIFRPGGALTTLANVTIALTNGASACDVFWTPIGATTIGADNNFIGTVIGSPAITVGNNVSWTGRALNNGAGGNVTFSLGNSTLTVPTCTTPAPATGTLHIIKTVVGGSTGASGFTLSLSTSTGVVIGSAVGTGTPGTLYTGLALGAYVVSETANAEYTSVIGGDCSTTGAVIIQTGDDKTCTITNTYIVPPVPVPTPAPSGGGGGGGVSLSVDSCTDGDYSSSYYDGECGTAPIVAPIVVSTTSTGSTGRTSTITRIIRTGSLISGATVIEYAPSFPKTGLMEEQAISSSQMLTLLIAIIGALSLGIIIRKHMIS